MRKLFEDMRSRVASFIEQRDRLTLVAALGAREHIALDKLLQTMDEGASPHVFCIFGQRFRDPEQYVSACVETSRLRHRDLISAGSVEGNVTFSPFPEHLLLSRLEPVQRLRELLVFMRSLIPSLSERNLVVAFLPINIEDSAGYTRLLVNLLEHELPVPWCHHMRFVVREASAEPKLAGALVRSRTVRYAPDLSDVAIEHALEADANDAAAPIEQRMQSLMILAGMDSAHRRTEQALEKYQLLASYHCELRNLPALALALNGMGEACAITSRPEEARRHFELALTPAVDAQDLPTLTNITFNLARLHQSQREWPLAIEYYQGLSKLARAALNAPLQVICHEQQGVCLRELGQSDDALEEWRAGATLSEGAAMPDQRLMFLRRSAELLAAHGRTSDARKLELQMEQLRKEGAQELPL